MWRTHGLIQIERLYFILFLHQDGVFLVNNNFALKSATYIGA